MSFAILRVEKLHQKGEFCSSAAHLTRERECRNANPELLETNQFLHGAKTTAHALTLRDERLAISDRKVRADAVTCLEYVMTASPEWYKDRPQIEIEKYHRDCVEWVKNKHGKENVLMAVVHNDETTPHLHIFAVPLAKTITKKNKEVYTLNAKSFTGNSMLLSSMQEDFAEKVGKAYGLERGIKGSTAHHQRVKSFYGSLQLETMAPSVEIPKKRLLERHERYKERAREYVQEQSQGWAVATKKHEHDKALKELRERVYKENEVKEKELKDLADRLRNEQNALHLFKKTLDALKIANDKEYQNLQKEKEDVEDLKSQLAMAELHLNEWKDKWHKELTEHKLTKEMYTIAQQKRENHVDFICNATVDEFKERKSLWRKELNMDKPKASEERTR